MKVTHQRVTADPSTPELGRIYMVQSAGGYRQKVTRNNGTLADMDAPTLAQHASKEDTITAGTTSQYWRGDKTWQTLDKTAVGLGNVDNTSDANKPISTAVSAALLGKVNTSEKGTANGVATLDANGLIPTGQLPSFVDDVLEGTFVSATLFNDPLGNPYVPESGKIYIHTATTPNQQYRWSGSAYVKISSGDVSEMANFFVRYDSSQTITEAQKTIARNNIGAISQTTGDERWLRLTGGTMKGDVVVKPDGAGGVATFLRTFYKYEPNDYGAGKPALNFTKLGNATQYQISLYDGVTYDGRLNFRMSELTWNSELLATRPWTTTNFAPIAHVGAGGTAHALATTMVAGFMSAEDKVKLNTYSETDTHWVEISGW